LDLWDTLGPWIEAPIPNQSSLQNRPYTACFAGIFTIIFYKNSDQFDTFTNTVTTLFSGFINNFDCFNFSSDYQIYGGLAGTYDYGPLGSLLKENIKQSWLKKFVHSRTDMYLVDAAILMNPKVWEATGHVDEFNDPLVDDLKTNKRYRADHLLEEHGITDAESLTPKEMTAKSLIKK
jgi:hypothetical protein